MKDSLIMAVIVWLITAFMYTVSILRCESQYTDSYYTYFWWCMVKYNWEYITEELYKKAFDTNLNLNLK